MAFLGCVVQYSAMIVSKGGIPLGEVGGITEVRWARELDDHSEAQITVPIGDPDCCAILSDVRTWHHDLVIFRDGELVWSGPVVQIYYGRKATVIIARDLLGLLLKRLIHNDLCFDPLCGGANADLTTIGAAIVNDAFIVDGHNYVLELFLTGIIGSRQYLAGEEAWAALNEALLVGLDATCVGRKIILGAAPWGTTATLTCDDFLGDIQFLEDGLSAVTRAIVPADGVFGVAGGEDPYYGLIEFRSNEHPEIKDTTSADAAAQNFVNAGNPPPTALILPDGSQLSPNAPVGINELIPGVAVPIFADCLCREIGATMILVKLDVVWNSEGESVSITTVNAGGTNGESDITLIG